MWTGVEEMKEFKLIEKRKELLKYFKEQFGKNSIIPDDILRVVKEQDKEFIRLLKEELIPDFIAYGRDVSDDGRDTKINEIIDKRTGDLK